MKLTSVIDDYVLLKGIERPETNEGGLIVLPGRIRQPIHWEVLIAGPGKFKPGDKAERIPLDVQEGDVVMLGSALEGQDIEHDEEKCKMVRYSKILAKVA